MMLSMQSPLMRPFSSLLPHSLWFQMCLQQSKQQPHSTKQAYRRYGTLFLCGANRVGGCKASGSGAVASSLVRIRDICVSLASERMGTAGLFSLLLYSVRASASPPDFAASPAA